MTLSDAITAMFSKRASSPAQRAVNAGAPDAAKDPTEGQKRVGNYQKVHLNIDGFRVSIENPKGSYRSGTTPDGVKWRNMLACDYGDIRGTEDTDGDPVDIYLSDHPEKGAVFVIDQIDPRTGKFDEHKVMYGFDSIEDATNTYLACYQKGWKGLGWITPVTKAEFRKWIDSSDRKTKPFHEYKSVTPILSSVPADGLGFLKKENLFVEKAAQEKDDPMDGVPAGVKLRSFIDAPATRTAIMDNVLEAVKNRFPIEDDDVRLELRDVKYEGPTSYTLQQQKDAILGNRRLGCSIAGTWRLTDKKTGQVLDERRDGVLRVPYYTDRGTIINNGSEYTVISQARLSPGVYVRRKQNGELESQFNVANGLGFRIGLNKETGALNMSVGQGHIPLYPVLRALGVSNEDIRKSWGDEVANVNIGQMDTRAIDKLYARYAGRRADPNLPYQDKIKFINEAMLGSGLDPEVVVRTLGMENVNGVTGQVMLRAAQKLLNINRGEEDPDERDNPRFSKFYGVEDMLRERIDKDSGRLTKSILWRAKRDKSLARIGRNALSPYLDTFLSGSGLAMPGEEANPLSILTQQSRITRMGEGGISSADLVTPEARNVQGDYLGYVDFISGPESFGIGVDVRAALGTMKGSDNRLYNKMFDMRTGKQRYVALDDAASHTVAFPGQDPKAPSLYAMRKGVPTLVPRDEVDYMVPGFQNTVSAGINMNPMPTAVMATRQFYMSKFWEQFLPQKQGEVPLVDSLMDDGKTTFSEFYGRKVGCLTAPFAGTVIKANGKEIVVRGKDGQTHTASIVQGLPFNRLSGITYIPQVKKGDEVQEGGILASSNFTDPKTGSMTMGRNLKVAVLPAPEGASSYEDAIVISESAAKKLATSRVYNFEQDKKEGVQVTRNKYLAAFPKAYTKDQAETIDENGVVKVGTVLHRDDPMILAIGPKMLSAEDAQLGKLSSVLRNAITDRSQKWEHDWPGVVTDVVSGAHGVKVLVKSEPPVKVGDKLVPDFSLKGVVGCYDSSTEVLTESGWKNWADVSMSDRLAVLPDGFGGKARFEHPSALYIYDYDGCLIHAHTEQLDYRVTGNHRMYCRIDHYRGHIAQYRIRTADDIFEKKVTHLCAAEFDYNDRETAPFDLTKYVDYDARRERKKAKTVFDGDDFAELLGWYVSEGNVAAYQGKGIGRSKHSVNSYKIQIAQSRTAKPDNCKRLESLLDRLGIKWMYHGLQYTFSSKPMYKLLSQLGLCNEKFLPDFVKNFSKRQIGRLFDGLMLGDGSVQGRKTVRSGIDYITTSPRLARQVEFIMTLLGYNAIIKVESRAGNTYKGKGRAKPCRYNFDKYTVCAKSLTELGQATAEFTRELYKGKVYCASVTGGLLYVRRNGRPMWCGNSILPDDKMPRDATTNEPYDMLMNPMGFLSRIAPGQVMLMNLAKIAKKTGKQMRIPQMPPPEGWQAWTERQMAENGVKESADVFDPQTGKTIKNVGDGYSYVKAFHHLAEKKFSARGVEGAYTQDEQPAKGGIDGAKRISGFDNLALLSHGATDVIKDSMVTRGQCFDEDTEVLTKAGWKYWREVSPTDELFTKNKDGEGSAFYEKPERLVVNPYNGIMYGYENRHIDWLVTPDHDLWGINCLVSKNKPYRRYRTFKAKDIFGKEGTIDAFGAVYPGSLPSDHVLEFVDEKDTRGKGAVKDVRMSIFDYCSFMGWWLSEGCASYNGLRGEIRICQDADIHPNEFREIVDLGRKIGLGNGSVGKRSNRSGFSGKSRIGSPTSIRWRSKPLALHLMQFGTRAWNKRIPEVIFEAPLDCRLEFIRCYVAGDGCTRITGHGYDSLNHIIGTSSPMMMHDLQRLAVISGLSAHIGLDKKSGEYNYKHDYYRVVIGNNTKETTISRKHSDKFKGHYKKDYYGYVYCATMSTGLVFVRRNGKCMWSGNCNDEYWRRYRLGLPVEEPGVPFIYKKFINTLKAGGVNVVEKGDVTSIMPQTDKDIDELAQGRVLENSQMVDSDFQPVKGGMFDLGKTGGMGGNRWSMITLPEAVPNPMMEEPVRRVLGLTAKKMEAVLSGREELNGKTGGDAIKDALSKVNVDYEIQKARADIRNRRGSQRDNAIKVLGYLKAAKEMDMKPEDWMITRVPVLPPMFRPVAKMGDVALVPDMNELYKELIEMKDNYEALSKELPASALADERLAVYGAVKAAYGLGSPMTTEGRAKNLKGAVRQIIGTVPKFGMFQSKVISKTQDEVGRSVTIPDKNLDMDQIGIPEDMAWTMYKPHVERKLVQRGYSPATAKTMIEERNATAKHILEDAMQERPVLMDRAPTWHKFNIMAFRPHIVKGRSIHVCPLIDSGYNMDHDGDTVNIHVPASEKAAKQALEKMLPSKNLFSLTDMKSMRYKPEKEQISGLWALTRGRTKRPTRYFNSKADAIAAYRHGEIGPNDPIEIKETT